jgi:hypothetical protein
MPRLNSPGIDSLSDEHGHELRDGYLVIERENQAERKEKLRLLQERRDTITASDEHGHELRDGHLVIERENQAERKEKLRLLQERRDTITARLREFLTEPNDEANVEDERFGDVEDVFNASERVSLSDEHIASLSAEDLFITAGILSGITESELSA